MVMLKNYFYLLSVFAISLTLFIGLLSSTKDYYIENYSISVFSTNATVRDEVAECVVPKLNPWDPSILKWITHPKDLSCLQVQPNLTFIDYDGYLRYNETELKRLNVSGISFTCVYKTFDRCPGTEDSCIEYGKENVFNKPTKLSTDSVDVKCIYRNKTQFYSNIHVHPADTEDRIFSSPTDEQLSVLLLIIDSTGYSVLQRNMPLTYNYTKNVMGMKYFEAYNKVGDNSFPNMMAMLTGKRLYDEQDDMMKEIDYNYNTAKHDSFPLIWKMFSGKGYATAYNEDTPLWGLFHYLAKGFAKKPVDFFYHTYWRAISKAYSKKHTSYCFANVPRPQLLIDLTKRHVISMSNRNKLNFIYSHSTEVAHDKDNDVERLDEPFLNFFQELYEGNYLNKTAIIFAADHGHRFSSVRKTTVGLLEERLPFYSLYFPPWFYKLHPNIEKSIDGNRNILSSSFDAYETMKDILDANYDGIQRKVSSRGQSQLYPILKNRTCKAAGIPNHYCTCVQEKPLNVSNDMVADCALSLVDNLNEILRNVSDLCYEIKLSKILYATQIDFDDKLKNGVKSYKSSKIYESDMKNKSKPDMVEKVRIAIETEPFEASFEAMMRNIKTKNGSTTWSLESGISRTNGYSGLSDCVKTKQLQKLCSCKDRTLKTKLVELKKDVIP